MAVPSFMIPGYRTANMVGAPSGPIPGAPPPAAPPPQSPPLQPGVVPNAPPPTGGGLPFGMPMATGPRFSGVGSAERQMADMFNRMFGGKRGRQLSNFMQRSAVGRPTAQQNNAFNRQLAYDRANTIESFGAGGARFGTDLANVLGKQSGDARVNFRAMLQDRANAAQQNVLNLGATTAGFQFQRGENAYERALKEFLGVLEAQTFLMGLLGKG